MNGFNLVHLDQAIFALAVQLINHYALSHHMTIYDAIVAATCMVYDLPLWTHNKKDFHFLTAAGNDPWQIEQWLGVHCAGFGLQ